MKIVYESKVYAVQYYGPISKKWWMPSERYTNFDEAVRKAKSWEAKKIQARVVEL